MGRLSLCPAVGDMVTTLQVWLLLSGAEEPDTSARGRAWRRLRPGKEPFPGLMQMAESGLCGEHQPNPKAASPRGSLPCVDLQSLHEWEAARGCGSVGSP